MKNYIVNESYFVCTCVLCFRWCFRVLQSTSFSVAHSPSHFLLLARRLLSGELFDVIAKMVHKNCISVKWVVAWLSDSFSVRLQYISKQLSLSQFDSVQINFEVFRFVYVWCYFIVNFHISSQTFLFFTLIATVWSTPYSFNVMNSGRSHAHFCTKPCSVYHLSFSLCVYMSFCQCAIVCRRDFSLSFVYWASTFIPVRWLGFFSFDAHLIVFSDFSLSI